MRSYRSATAPAVIVVLVALCCACTERSHRVPAPPGILTFTAQTLETQAQRLRDQSASPRVCGDGTGAFAVDPRVPFEWAPIVPGHPQPVVEEPQFVAGGVVARWGTSATAADPLGVRGDIMFTHPFGSDNSWDIRLDAASYRALAHPDPGSGSVLLHAEIERGLLPDRQLGWGMPRPGDAVLVEGDWVMDCGHPEDAHAEIHPPSFLALARQSSADSTDAVAFAVPYRTTQLFNADPTRANAFTDAQRFTAPGTKPFPAYLAEQIDAVVAGRSGRLAAHVLVEPARFGSVAWELCAPRPRPAHAQLRYSFRFTARTGVSIRTSPESGRGCVRVTADQTPQFVAAPLPTPAHVPWRWADIEAAAAGEGHPPRPADVKARVYALICARAHGCGDIRYPAVEQDPLVDADPPQQPLPGATADTPTGVTTRDDQPFPFYGHVHVSWSAG